MVLQSLLLASRPIRLRTPILRRCGIFARIPRGRRIRRQAMACGDLMRGLAYDRGRLVAFIRRARRLRVVACTSVIGSRFGPAVLTKRTLHHTGFALGRFRNGGFFGDGCGIFTATAVATPPRAAAPTAASTAATTLTTCRGLAGLAADRLSVGRGGGRLRSDGDGRHRHGCFLYGRRGDGLNFGLCRGGRTAYRHRPLLPLALFAAGGFMALMTAPTRVLLALTAAALAGRAAAATRTVAAALRALLGAPRHLFCLGRRRRGGGGGFPRLFATAE